MSRTWLLSGIPRSGTSLCCRLADGLPDTVALSEPIRPRDFGGMGSVPGACARIGDFVRETRAGIRREHRAPSVHVDGRLDDNRSARIQAGDGLRRLRREWGRIAVRKPLSADFTLIVKHNALFAALLPELEARFPCLALVRNPLSALASWQTVALPVHRGRIPVGEALDPDLHRTLEREPDVLRRQLVVLDWFFVRYRDGVAPENVLRYEDLVASGGTALFRRLGHEDAPPVVLESRNRSTLYDGDRVGTLLRALLERGGAWTHFYSPADLERAADSVRGGGGGTAARRPPSGISPGVRSGK